MTPIHAILVLIIRLWAAGIILSSVATASLWPFDLWDEQTFSNSFAIRNYIYTGFWFLVGFPVWVLAPRIARAVYAGTKHQNVEISIDADTLVMIGCFLIGTFYLVQYVPSFVMNSLYIFIETAQHDSSLTRALGNLVLTRSYVDSAINSILSIAIASWMAFRPAHIAIMFSKLRRAGLAKVEEGSPKE